MPNEEEVAAAAGQDSGSGDPYFLPRGGAEVDRLDVQHYALGEALGSNRLAPLERPARILDVGCGTGQWAYELCAEFPGSLVFGFDLQRSKAPWPARFRFVQGNLLPASACAVFLRPAHARNVTLSSSDSRTSTAFGPRISHILVACIENRNRTTDSGN
jgi:SAM-dependent methyltransferase